jgi:glycosyltransferase involved in cell wall biosynthesis
MPVKTYGIFLAYQPTVDLHSEGLGRYLAEFLKGAQERDGLHLVIACPSWLRGSLTELLDTAGIRTEDVEIISPSKKPLLLVLREGYLTLRSRRRGRGPVRAFFDATRTLCSKAEARIEKHLAGTRSLFLVALFGLILSLAFVAGAVGLMIARPFKAFFKLMRKIKSRVMQAPAIVQIRTSLVGLIAASQGDLRAVRMYRHLVEAEENLILRLIRQRKDVCAWYCPTAFWPHFNDIQAPRLMCVPDVVLADFPIAFADMPSSKLLGDFREVERAIQGGEYFVTYSEDVKWRTLVDRYHADPSKVAVVRHGANRLDGLITVSGFPDNEAATEALCRSLFRSALQKSSVREHAETYGSAEICFLFYASQFRPNKNILSLLKAYDYLLRRRHIGHKLVLTGSLENFPGIRRYITEHQLENDVLCLHGLSLQELAACYRLADLAVNPSLSEGGCPFTFTEALSVGTPVVMARIAVTEEVVTQPDLQEFMLFDPYDWKNMADRIEWALNNRRLLFERQKPFYEQLTHRTWRHAVDEYLEILDRISSGWGLAGV